MASATFNLGINNCSKYRRIARHPNHFTVCTDPAKYETETEETEESIQTFSEAGADPTSIEDLSATLRGMDPEGRLSQLGMKRIEVGREALGFLEECVSELVGERFVGGVGEVRVVLVTDATGITRSGEDLKELVWGLLSKHYAMAERVVIGGGRAKLYADDEAISEAGAAVRGADCVVVVGSGTITDICKVAISGTGETAPLVVVQTAASVDGFSDDVSVVLKSGVKRTIPSRWPEVLLADLPTIIEAPAEMTAAGYGDAISMYTAPADWRLAAMVGLDGSYHPAPVSMLLEGGPDIIGAAEGVGRLEPEAMEKLVRLLALRGIASGVSGSTAILSGAEHVVSHMLDMHAGQTGEKTGIHGAQVGVATVLVAAAWQVLLERFDPSEVDIDACFPHASEMEEVVRNAFDKLDATGAVGGECWSDYEQKLSRWHENRDGFEAMLGDWPTYRDELAKLVASPEELAGSLALVGAPVSFAELDPEVSAGTIRWAMQNCHFMRNRFNVVDLLYFIGWWDAEFVEGLLERVNGLGGAADRRQG